MRQRHNAEKLPERMPPKPWVVTLSTGGGKNREYVSYRVRAKTAERAIFAARAVCIELTGTIYGHVRPAGPQDLPGA